MADNILLINASTECNIFNIVKATVKRNKDKLFNFEILPNISSMYKKDKPSKIFRQKLIYGDKKLVACFFEPAQLEYSLPLILEIMEFYDKVILLCQKQDIIYFDSQKLSFTLGIEVIEAQTDYNSIKNIIDTLKSNAASLFYKSQCCLNYGYDFSNALGFIDYVVRNKFRIENSNWLGVRLLENDRFFLREYSKKMGISLDNKEILKQVNTARTYLNNTESGFDAASYINQVKADMIESIVKFAIEKEPDDFCFINKEYLRLGVFWLFVIMFFIFAWFVVNLN